MNEYTTQPQPHQPAFDPNGPNARRKIKIMLIDALAQAGLSFYRIDSITSIKPGRLYYRVQVLGGTTLSGVAGTAENAFCDDVRVTDVIARQHYHVLGLEIDVEAALATEPEGIAS